MTEYKSRPFIVRHYRHAPVVTVEDDRRMARPYRGQRHDPETDERSDGYELHNILGGLPEDGTVYEIIVRPTGAVSPLGKVPWVLVEPHRYGPNPTGELQPAQPEPDATEGR